MAGNPKRVSRGLALALFVAAMAWVGGANSIAGRAAHGLGVRFQLGAGEALLSGVFLLFLMVVGFSAFDLVAAKGSQAADVLPLPRRHGWWTEWSVGAAIGWGLCLLAVFPLLVTRNLHSRLDLRGTAWGSVAVAAASLLVASLLEEAVFRGYPFQRLKQAIGTTLATIFLSISFGIVLVYANPPQHVGLAVFNGTLFGLLLSMAYLRTHALWLGWGLHFGYRVIAAMVLGLPIAGRGDLGSVAETWTSGPRWLSGGAFGLDAALLTGPVLLLGMIVLYRVTKGYAWEYTHATILPGGYQVAVAPPAAHATMEQSAAPPPLVQIAPSTSTDRSIS